MPDPSQGSPHPSVGPWHPLRIGIFRNLLIADLVSDIGTFMQTVGAAWLMTTLTRSSLYIALIQTASALPFFLLALPAGSIGDIFDRRKLILGTESWMLAIATILTVATYFRVMTPWLLLTLALSLGDAVESPTWRAIFPELVKKDDLTPALALNEESSSIWREGGGAGTGRPDHRGVRGCDRVFPQCCFVFWGDPGHLHLETPQAKERLAAGNARGSQRSGDSLRALLARNPHAASAIGNCHLFRKFLLGSPAGSCKRTEHKYAQVQFASGLFWSRRRAWSNRPAACHCNTLDRSHHLNGDGDLRCNSH